MASAEGREPSIMVDWREASSAAGLIHIDGDMPGITRRRAGTGFAYRTPAGAPVKDTATLARIRKLAIPPAYRDVWICPRDDGHIQATGRDAKGRKQYRYHADFRALREGAKYEHITAFAQVLPHLRSKVAEHMVQRGLPRTKVIATIVYLLEETLIRVGNEDYARQNKSFGLTTLRRRHVAVEGGSFHLEFKGKSRKLWRLDIRNRRVATILRACSELRGQHLFQYVDEEGGRHDVDSGDVNDYLREVTGRDVTAKDFRTWAGTVLAALALAEFGAIDGEAAAKKNIRSAIESVASRLGNTPTICRKCYIHPEIVNAYLSGEVLREVYADIETELRENLPALKPEEAAVLALLDSRIKRAISQGQPSRRKEAA